MAESILHFGAVTLRVNGFGNLDMTLRSLDDTKTADLRPLAMNELTAIQPTRLSNFNTQRASLRISTNEFGEYFIINRIVLWAKEIYTQYPSVING